MMLTVEKTIIWLNLFEQKVGEKKAYLSELDQAIGDGDHGANMARGTSAMKTALEQKAYDTVQDVFKAAGMALLSKIGGASGPLYGSAFIGMAKQSGEGSADVSAILEEGLLGIQKRGKAQAGDKTMVDVWLPAVDAVKNKKLTRRQVEEWVKATGPMKAKKGRASYLGDRSIGHIDPGAVSSGLLFEAMIEGGVLDE